MLNHKSRDMRLILGLLLFIVFLFVYSTSIAQTTEEEMPYQCDNLPREEKTVVAVSDFQNSSASSYWEIGTGMSDMLTNALVQSGCFRVVERQQLDHILQEQDLGATDRVNPGTAAQIGNITGAQMLIMGNITEFSETESGGALGFVSKAVGAGGVGKMKSHVGLIVKVIDSATGEIMISKSIDHKRTKVGGIGGTQVLGVGVGGGFFKSQAMEDAVESAIMEATGLIVDQRSILPPPSDLELKQLVTVTISNAGFADFTEYRKVFEGMSGLEVLNKSFSDGKIVFNIALDISADDLAVGILDSSDGKLEITGFSETAIEASIK